MNLLHILVKGLHFRPSRGNDLAIAIWSNDVKVQALSYRCAINSRKLLPSNVKKSKILLTFWILVRHILP